MVNVRYDLSISKHLVLKITTIYYFKFLNSCNIGCELLKLPHLSITKNLRFPFPSIPERSRGAFSTSTSRLLKYPQDKSYI